MFKNLETETKRSIGKRTIAFAKIKVRRDDDTGGYDDFQYFCLQSDYSSSDLQNFWEGLRGYSYNDDHEDVYIGSVKHQCVFGFIVFTDGTWLERMYDGSEWWSSQRVPEFTDYV